MSSKYVAFVKVQLYKRMDGFPSYFLFFIKINDPAKLIPMTWNCLESFVWLKGRTPTVEVELDTTRKLLHS